MKKLIALLLLCSVPMSSYAFDLGIISKALDVGKKTAEANRDIPESEEVQIGAGVTSNILGTTKLVDNPEMQRYVNHVGMWLASQTERSGLKWHFGVIDTDTVNAFSMPGGYVLITRGLFSRLHSEAELAGVLGHEISHVVQKHHLKAIQKAMGREALGQLAQIAADQNGSQGSQNLAKVFKGGTELYAHGLDKDDEFEADRLGVVVAARGGYNPYGLVAVLQTLGAINPSDAALKLLFDTHPTPADRLDRLGAAMGDKLDDLGNKIDDVPRFEKLKR
ncbi:MAG: M48 family metalloprotease [Burkholderiales bacterium]|nr:M48 family metalloprotease [Burkholderiales bacterium]